MKAVIYEQYGNPDVLRLTEVEKPTPAKHDVRIKLRAASVTYGDCRVRSLNVPRGFGLIMRLVFGISRPRQPILGTELSGVIDAVGSEVTKFKVGDAVFAFSDMAMGCYAEYKCMSENAAVVAKPANLSFEEAAALSFGGTTALDFLKKANLKSGESILVNGASGGVGTAIVQLGAYFGAVVTGVCSTANVELVKSLGATHVIDYAREDFTKNGCTYDIIVDTVGNAHYSRCKKSLKKQGRLLLVIAGLKELLTAPLISMSGDKRVIAAPVTVRVDDLQFLADLAAAGNYKPYIDRCYPMTEIVDAHRYVDSGRKRGNVVIKLPLI
jgi:NADPH:quinone reductase-like Zn-dependent oxidoreductase